MKSNVLRKAGISSAAKRLLAVLLCAALLYPMIPAVQAANEDTPISERVNEIPDVDIPVQYSYEEHQIRFVDALNTHGDNPTGTPTVTVTFREAFVDLVDVTGAVMSHPVGNMTRYFTVLTAGDIYTAQMHDTTIHKWVDINIDTTQSADSWIRDYGMDVYLVGFGMTVEGDTLNQLGEVHEHYEHPAKGIRNITVNGSHVNVYLVGCNVGTVKTKQYDGYGYTFYDPYSADSARCTFRVCGLDNHIYMDNGTNAEVAGQVGCRVQVDGSLPEGYYYNPEDGYLHDSNRKYGTPDELRNTAELSNLRICQMGSAYPENGFNAFTYPNGVLDGISGVTLNNCQWGPGLSYTDSDISRRLDKVTLNNFAKLTLINTSPVSVYGESEYENEYASIELNHLSALTISGETGNFITVKGRNDLYLKDAAFRGKTGKILVEGENNANTDAYLPVAELEHVTNYPADSGARLSLWLGGNNTILTANSNNFSPDIMVAELGILLLRDDPDVAGVGSLTVGSDESNGDGGHAYCAAIGGTASLDPKPHGSIRVISGILTAYSQNGGAAIGGSNIGPVINYKKLAEEHDLVWEGDPADLIRIYQNQSVGYLYYDESDDRFNPYKGGYWLREEYSTYYAVQQSDQGNWVHVVIDAVYELDDQGNRKIDYDESVPGFSRDAGELSVSGGVVNATAMMGAAAIGGANGGSGGSFAIAGGTVNAKSSGGGAAIGGGKVIWGHPVRTCIGFLTRHDWENENPLTWDDGIYTDRYEYDPSKGGGSGHIYIYGGVVNACADNPAYDEFGDSLTEAKYYYENGSQYYPKEFDPDADEWVWNTYYTYTDQEYVLSFEDGVYTGRMPGYVIGSTCENANSYYENTTEILKMGHIDCNPVLLLQQNKNSLYGGAVNASWDNFYRKQNPQGVMTQDALGRDPNPDDLYHDTLFDPALITGACFILGAGWEDTRVYDDTTWQCISGSEGYTAKPLNLMENYTYRIRGQMNFPDLPYNESGDGIYTLTLPSGTALDLLPGSVLNVPEHMAVMAADMSQFRVEESAVVQGKGRWPGKPAEPESAPSTAQVRSLLATFGNETSANPDAPIVVTHLAIVRTGDGMMVIPGNGAETVKSRASALGLPVLTVFSAGTDGFRGETISGVTTWKLNTRSADTVISLLENGALTATPGNHTNYNPDLIVRDDNEGDVTITLQSVNLHTPEYTVYKPHGTDDQLELLLENPNSSMAFRINFDDEQVVNNDAVFSVPSFSGSEFRLDSVSPLRDKCAVRFGGCLSFSTPFADFGNITINQLQLKYGNGTQITGIEGGGSVNVPSIAGFPVSGGASMQLNTFAPHRMISLSVELETPIFSGAFETSFKEVRGIILLDTLYAELSVDEGGIPLVPPTVIGYIQGGGLGISGLADTVAMDSFGAPPVRLNVAAKGSIVDVIEGWIRLSVGLDGFDLTMEDIEVADMDFIKEFGVSAKWDAGEREIKGKTYWGLSADLEQYMVIAVPATIASHYGGEDDELPMLFSATGTIGFGGFTGYYKEDGWIYFIYQLHASGSLKGSITIPKKLVGGVFPFKSVNLANAEIGFYAAANASSKVDSSSGKVSGSPSKVLRDLASNAKLSFDAAVGAKLVIGTGAFRFYLRAVYVFGEKAPRLSAGYGEGSDLDLSGISNRSAVTGKSYKMIGELEDPETGERVPAVVEMAAKNIAQLQISGNNRNGASGGGELGAGVRLMRLRSGNSFSADVASAVVGSTFLAITLSNANAILTTDDLTVTFGGEPVALTAATYDDEGNQTNTANFFADAGVVYFAPGAAGTYTITSTSEIDKVDVIQTTAFASLDPDETTISGSAANYSVKEADENTKYKVQLVLGKEKGDGDCLLAETAELTGSASYEDALSFDLTGSLAPDGDYYPSVLLTEYIEVEGENGEVVKTWTLVDQKSFEQTVHYTNNVIPDAPENVELVYSGNKTMTASWNGVQDANAYQISVYDGNGNDTGLRFRTNDASLSMILDLSSLEAGKNYRAGVKALIYDDPTDTVKSTYKLSYEGVSDPAALNDAVRPVVTYSGNVMSGEGNSHNLTVGANGVTFTVRSDIPLNMTVTNTETGAVLASGSGVTSLDCAISAQGADAKPITLQVLAVNAATQDYALDRINVSIDTIAPPLMLDKLGVYTLNLTETGYAANITGTAEGGASVLVYQKDDSNDNSYKNFIAGVIAGENGTFSIPLRFDLKPGENDLYCVIATDAAGNASAPMSITFMESQVTVNLVLNDNNAVCSTGAIGVASGEPVGKLPEPYFSDVSKLFDGWYYIDANGAEVDVTAATAFTSDTSIYARWVESVKITYYENGVTVAEFPAKSGRRAGALESPKIVKENQIFTGWFTAESGGSLVTEDTVFTSDAVLYARWSPYFTVVFNAGQGSVTVGEIRVPADGPHTIDEYPVPTAKGYTFVGWYSIDGDGAEVDADAATVFNADTVLYARWSRNMDTTSLRVKQEGCSENEVLPDPDITLPLIPVDKWAGETTMIYTGTGATNYMSAIKPTEPGSYRLVVQRNTYETAYVGTTDFTITPSGTARYEVTAAGAAYGAVGANKSTAEPGETVTLIITPESGYEPESVTYTVEGGETYTVTADAVTGVYSFTMPEANVTLNASFRSTGIMSELSFYAASVTLQNDLKINYYVKKDTIISAGLTDLYAEFEWNGKTVTTSDYSEDASGTYYVFSYGNIAPNQMNDVMYATLHGEKNGLTFAGETLDYSITRYCGGLLNDLTGEKIDSMKDLGEKEKAFRLRTLLVDLLNYGAASQEYTDRNTANPANGDLTAEQLAYGTSADPVLKSSTDTKYAEDGYSVIASPEAVWKAVSLSLSDSVIMEFKFTAADTTGLSIEIRDKNGALLKEFSGDEITPTDDGRFKIRFRELTAKQMKDTVFVTVYRSGTAVSNTLRYSIESYAASKATADPADKLSNLVKAMMKYGASANAYASN